VTLLHPQIALIPQTEFNQSALTSFIVYLIVIDPAGNPFVIDPAASAYIYLIAK
jgi:hypothetical protein